MIKIISKEDFGHTTRYRLSNGWFIDRANVKAHRYHQHQAYAIWEPGASQSGMAAYRGGGNTQQEALAAIG